MRAEQKHGVLKVAAQVLVDGKIASSCLHQARKFFPLERFNERGQFVESKWRPTFLWLTQFTLWAPRQNYFSGDYSPFRAFITDAIASARPVEARVESKPFFDAANSPNKPTLVKGILATDTLVVGADVPGNNSNCSGTDGEHSFSVSEATGSISWKSGTVESGRIPRVYVNGYPLRFTSTFCEPNTNRFWVGRYYEGRVHLWQYEVNRAEASYRMSRWLRFDIPESEYKFLDKISAHTLQIDEAGDGDLSLYLVNHTMFKPGVVGPTKGYRLKVTQG